jgi:hypothetical protein
MATAIASPETDQVAGTDLLAGPVVPLTPERIIESDELLGAGAHDLSFDGLASKVLVQGEAISAPPGRADDFAWRRPDCNSARADPIRKPNLREHLWFAKRMYRQQ